MSRNLGRTDCAVCDAGHDDIALCEQPRPITERDAGRYYAEYKDRLIVANAECTTCGAKYLAWISIHRTVIDRQGTNFDNSFGVRFCDISFRSTFNDEPGPDDLPSLTKLREIEMKRWTSRAHELTDQLDEVRERLDAHVAELGSLRSRWESYL